MSLKNNIIQNHEIWENGIGYISAITFSTFQTFMNNNDFKSDRLTKRQEKHTFLFLN